MFGGSPWWQPPNCRDAMRLPMFGGSPWRGWSFAARVSAVAPRLPNVFGGLPWHRSGGAGGGRDARASGPRRWRARRCPRTPLAGRARRFARRALGRPKRRCGFCFARPHVRTLLACTAIRAETYGHCAASADARGVAIPTPTQSIARCDPSPPIYHRAPPERSDLEPPPGATNEPSIVRLAATTQQHIGCNNNIINSNRHANACNKNSNDSNAGNCESLARSRQQRLQR